MHGDTDRANWACLGRRWADEDPDPDTARALLAIIESGDVVELGDCFSPPLEFGTAGLRGVVGPGPARMNLAVIRRVTRALGEVVKRQQERRLDASGHGAAPLVLGFDGRIDSEAFAREAVGILAGMHFPVVFFDKPVPTPVVAFAAQRFASPAAIVVTASHNPPQYNGYKVYGADAIQIVPPFDLEVTAEIGRVGAARDIPIHSEAFDGGDDWAERLDDAIGSEYVEAVVAARVKGASAGPIRIAYTPLHGVGASWVERVFRLAGYSDLTMEPSQASIDGRFPTVTFPNPEEPAALSRGLRLASDIDADVLLVNDPDADRMGAALRARNGRFRILSGNEIGVILTDYLLAHAAVRSEAAVATTIVSTPMVRRIAAQYGAHAETTLTGFKWLWTAMRSLEQDAKKHFALCWEEALGYSTHATVRDKDGIAAALVLADWVSECQTHGITPLERLSDLYRRHGVWASAPCNVIRPIATGVAEIERMMARLAHDPPTELAGRRVINLLDYSQGAERRPAWCGATMMFVLEVDGGARIVVRPSGTEPKLKCYADVEAPIGMGEDPLQAYERGRQIAEALNEDLVRQLEVVLLRES
jgi:phosphomannomutase